MLSLRKQRLNEQFEVLGDLFDIGETTAQQYYAETKNFVSSLYHSSTSAICSPEIDDVKNPLCTEDHQSTDDDYSSSELGVVKYKGEVDSDSDVISEDLDDESTDDESDELVNSELESDDLDGDTKLVKETVKCPLCGRHVGRLDHHMETAHLNPQYVYKTICGLCFGKFPTRKLLRRHHSQVHNGASCLCDVCQKSFTKFSAVKIFAIFAGRVTSVCLGSERTHNTRTYRFGVTLASYAIRSITNHRSLKLTFVRHIRKSVRFSVDSGVVNHSADPVADTLTNKCITLNFRAKFARKCLALDIICRRIAKTFTGKMLSIRKNVKLKFANKLCSQPM